MLLWGTFWFKQEKQNRNILLTKCLLRFGARGTTFFLLIYFHASEPCFCVPDRSPLPSTGVFSPRLGSRTRSLAGSSNPCFCPFLASSPTFSLKLICSGSTFRGGPRLCWDHQDIQTPPPQFQGFLPGGYQTLLTFDKIQSNLCPFILSVSCFICPWRVWCLTLRISFNYPAGTG